MRARPSWWILAFLVACGRDEPRPTPVTRPTPAEAQAPADAPRPQPERGPISVGTPRPDAAAPARAAPAPVPVAAERDASPRAPAPAPDGIRKLGPGEYTVERALVESWKEAPGVLGRTLQVDGGWQLSGMQKRVGYHLGLRNGDIITSINEHPLDTRMQQLGAWMSLRNADELSVAFTRGGERLVYEYRVIE